MDVSFIIFKEIYEAAKKGQKFSCILVGLETYRELIFQKPDDVIQGEDGKFRYMGYEIRIFENLPFGEVMLMQK